MRPASYELTLIRESEPGEIQDPNLRLYPAYPIFPGLSRLEVTVKWSEGRWWESQPWLIAPPPETTSLASIKTAPVPSTSASDGHRIWMEDPGNRTITLYPFSPAGTWPGTEHFLMQFRGQETLEELVQNNVRKVEPALHGDAEIAGRPAHVLEFGPDERRRPRGRGGMPRWRLFDGRLVVWIDQETHFTLRGDQYTFDDPDRLLLRWWVTSIRYNVPLDSTLFQLTVPAGYRLIEEQ